MSQKILILVTNHAFMGASDEANGTYAPEITHALHAFLEANKDYDIASIKGGAAPLYGTDVEGDPINAEVLADKIFTTRITNTKRTSELNLDDYDAVFYPGGFGLLSDLADNEDVGKLTAELFEKGAVIGAVCHGPAGLLPVKLSNGKYLIENLTVTGFTREEEIAYGSIDKIPFLLEEALTLKAGQYSKVAPWGEFVIEQDRVITGQNPTSARAVGESMLRRLVVG